MFLLGSEVPDPKLLHCREGCTAALELLKRVAERGPWAALLQDAAAHWAVRPSRLMPYFHLCECLHRLGCCHPSGGGALAC